VFEVTTLASRAPRSTRSFIAEIGEFGERAGFEWLLFTVTRRLHLLIKRLGITPCYLGDADRSRIADPERWGSYYAAEPKVYAVASRRLNKRRACTQTGEQHAKNH
jgi:hypothetical protein